MKKIDLHCLVKFLIVILWLVPFCVSGQKERSEIPDKYKWDLTPLFKSDEAWETEKNDLVTRLNEIEHFKGTIMQSSSDLLACLEYVTAITKRAAKLFIYSNMNSDLDTRDMKYSSMQKELEQIFSEFSAKEAFIDPEILKADWSLVEQYLKNEPKLGVYKKNLMDLFREKEHILSEPEERILALSELISSNSYSAYNTFKNAEMPSPEVTLTNGEKAVLTSAGYSRYRAVANRSDREIVFKAFWDNYKNYEATMGELLYGDVKARIFTSKSRNYNSTLEAALYPNNIPVEVYYSLVDNVNANLPTFHRYLEIKKRMLGVDTLKYLDLYAPVSKDIELKYTFDQAKELILKALAPLGSEYISTVKKAFDERWIDVYPTRAKSSGAYSNGDAYDVHPYILLNYNDLYNDVSTLAHELGHTMHSFFSNKTQPYPTAIYTTFVAEVASTFNEVLLFHEMMKEIEDDDVRLSLLMEWLDSYKGTLFRQTQFAEYELKIHEAAEKGQPLTGEVLSRMYEAVVKKYYGHDKGICFVGDNISMEWAFIPHFYYGYYVYQYSTSFTASISLAERVINKEEGALEQYLQFISSGGSDYPIELLKRAGVDMTTTVPFDKTIASMNAVMDEIEKILDRRTASSTD